MPNTLKGLNGAIPPTLNYWGVPPFEKVDSFPRVLEQRISDELPAHVHALTCVGQLSRGRQLSGVNFQVNDDGTCAELLVEVTWPSSLESDMKRSCSVSRQPPPADPKFLGITLHPTP